MKKSSVILTLGGLIAGAAGIMVYQKVKEWWESISYKLSDYDDLQDAAAKAATPRWDRFVEWFVTNVLQPGPDDNWPYQYTADHLAGVAVGTLTATLVVALILTVIF